MSINRRRLLKASTSAAVVGALTSFRGTALAQAGELRVALYGGEVGKAGIEVFVKPFMAETGIKVQPITDDTSVANLELIQKSGNVTVDLCGVGPGTAYIANGKGLLDKVDYSIFKKEELDALPEACKQPFGLSVIFYSYVMAYNTEKFPAGKPRPRNWAEF